MYEVFLVKATFVLQLPGVRIERQKLQNRLDLKLTLSDYQCPMLDSQGNLDVGFKPPKKMKKRRELDALVGSGKTRRKMKNGHELLRTESESSEVDEFLITDRKSFMRQ